jgi:hypothetical protein
MREEHRRRVLGDRPGRREAAGHHGTHDSFEELTPVPFREGGHAMTGAEIAILSVLIAAVVVSVWLGIFAPQAGFEVETL